MRRVGSIVACWAIVLAGCRHASPEERMNKLLDHSDVSGPPDNTRHRPAASNPTPERIHGGII
jgi:hypothetical protein